MILNQKKIAIIGLGGLGGFVAEYAARLNFGRITLIDGDTFNESNMNRQLLCTNATLGTYKVFNYKKHIQEFSKAEVIAVNEFLTKKNTSLIEDCDLVFDCLDNIEARMLLEKACSKNNIPIVHGAIGENFGNACLCLPGSKTLQKLYKSKEESKLQTQCHVVSLIASVQMELAFKYFYNKYEDVIDKIIFVDLEEFDVKTLKN